MHYQEFELRRQDVKLLIAAVTITWDAVKIFTREVGNILNKSNPPLLRNLQRQEHRGSMYSLHFVKPIDSSVEQAAFGCDSRLDTVNCNELSRAAATRMGMLAKAMGTQCTQ